MTHTTTDRVHQALVDYTVEHGMATADELVAATGLTRDEVVGGILRLVRDGRAQVSDDDWDRANRYAATPA